MTEKLNALLATLPIEQRQRILPTNQILIGLRGSMAHGLYLDPKDPLSVDDIDLMGVCVGSIDCYFGLESWGNRGTQETMFDSWDVVQYEVTKFVSLLEGGNPNVLPLLWLPEDQYLRVQPPGKWLINNRALFSTKRTWGAFRGYAKGQLHRMHKGEFKGHLGAKRRDLFERFGYDVKAAAHLVRIVRMAREFLTDGQLRVYREDADELLSIKKGEWPEDRIIALYTDELEKAERAYETSPLPEEPNRKEINDLLYLVLCYEHHLIRDFN